MKPVKWKEEEIYKAKKPLLKKIITYINKHEMSEEWSVDFNFVFLVIKTEEDFFLW